MGIPPSRTILSSHAGATPTPNAAEVSTSTELCFWLEQTGVDAVWVGWGAPNEHRLITEACETTGVTFVTPGVSALTVSSDPAALEPRVTAAGLTMATGSHRASSTAIEVRLLVMTGINVGAQPYFNAVATDADAHRGIPVMTPGTSRALTGKRALERSGSVSAEDDLDGGGYNAVMGPNGQA